MSDDEPCEDELLTPVRIVWKYGSVLQWKFARDELLTPEDIAFKYGFSSIEILGLPKFPEYHLTSDGRRMYLKKEVEAFLKENKKEVENAY
jgi:hypothetical protein